MVDSRKVDSKARAYASEHGQQSAREIVEWRRTGIYKGSSLAQLAEIISADDRPIDFQMAEALVVQVALEKLAADAAPGANSATVAQE